MPNRLIHETSPYLRQHAHNPVDWYPWGEEAFRKAREEDKPIFLSIGYAACHWCHVMERESFEDPETAEILNRYFVPVKVDREERPDVDQIYMNAVQAMTGHGGWPLSVFLTPDGVPFYGGTYFPPTDRYGLPSFKRVLLSIAQAWQTQRDRLLAGGAQVLEQITRLTTLQGEGDLTPRLLENAYHHLARHFDDVHGGFGTAPKFPQPMNLDLLLRVWRRFGFDRALLMVERTLDHMARGGIYDQIGGGFHRYSVDAMWLVPHFEKMLYDNALIPRVYLHAWQITRHEMYRRVVEETLTYVLRDMRHPEGAFYSSQDADSEGEEGKFYLWTPEEIDAVLDPESARVVKAYYGVQPGGNFEGKSILHVPAPADVVAERLNLPLETLEAILAEARQRLYEARARRVWPERDEKVILAWNGMMIATLAEAGRVLAEPKYVQAAAAAARFCLHHLRREDGRLWHTWKDGVAKVLAYLDDYGHFIDGLLRLYEATFEYRWLAEAEALAEAMIDLFRDPDTGLFYDTGRDHETLIVRPRDVLDNAYPSGNAVAADVLWRLGVLLDKPHFREEAERILRSVAEPMERMPTGFGHMLGVLDMVLGPMDEVALVAGADPAHTEALIAATFGPYHPNKVVAFLPQEPDPRLAALPLLQHKQPLNGRAAAYVCRGYTCDAPTDDPEHLRRTLAGV